MPKNKLINYSLIILAGGMVFLFVAGYLLIRWSFNLAEQHYWDQFTVSASERLETMEFEIKSMFPDMSEHLRQYHQLAYSDPSLGSNQERLQYIAERFAEKKVLGLVYLDKQRNVLAQWSAGKSLIVGESNKENPELKKIRDAAKAALTKGQTEIISNFEGPTRFFVALTFLDKPLSPSEMSTADDPSEAPTQERAEALRPAALVALLDFSWIVRQLQIMKMDKDMILWIAGSKGEVLYHPNPALSEGIGDSQNGMAFFGFIKKAVREKRYSGDYPAVSNTEGLHEFSVSHKMTLSGSDYLLVLSVVKEQRTAHLTIAMRGFLITLLAMFIVVLILGQFWQRFKREEIQAIEKERMSRDLEKMVEARTVELNFVTRTIKDLIDSIPSGLLVLDRHLNILLVNLSFYSIFSSRLVNITGRKVTEIFSEDFRDRLQMIIRTKEPIIDLEIRKYIEGHGEKVLLINVLHLLGKRDRLLLVIDDITERKVLERQLIQAEKMAGLGTLMSGIAHEINNPLNAIAGMAQIILARAKDAEIQDDSKQIVQYVNRVAEIVKELSRYSRSSKVTDAIMSDIHQIIEGSLAMVGHSRKLKDVNLEKDFSHDLPSIKVNVVELEQVFINLVTNAVDALEEASSRRGESFVKTLGITTSLYNGDHIQIVVKDNGTGIPSEHLKSIFDPFFSTKEQGKGTGLGLSISYKIIQRYGGIILVDSHEGHGTKFTIRIPVSGA